MKSKIVIPLKLNSEDTQRLHKLQISFAEVCNAISPLAQKARCWNRVGLHHLVYHSMREQFPQMGSQMICNAIYSVSRACRQVYQNPSSPWFIQKSSNQPLPMIKFTPAAPVFFDRHTLSLKEGQLSMFTMDGRIRFQAKMPPEASSLFVTSKLRETMLINQKGGFKLSFTFTQMDDDGAIEVDSNYSKYLKVTQTLATEEFSNIDNKVRHES
jgi:hypothetical protein